jgi:hypothetical protein
LLRNSLYFVLIAVLYQQGKKFTSKKWPLNSGGFAAPGWQKVADVFNKHLEQGSELGGLSYFLLCSNDAFGLLFQLFQSMNKCWYINITDWTFTFTICTKFISECFVTCLS